MVSVVLAILFAVPAMPMVTKILMYIVGSTAHVRRHKSYLS